MEKKINETKLEINFNLLARCETLTGAHAGKVLHILDVLECGLHLFLQKFVLLLLGEQVVYSSKTMPEIGLFDFWCRFDKWNEDTTKTFISFNVQKPCINNGCH